MMAIGSIGPKDEADNPAYRAEWRHSLNGKLGSVLTVNCTFSRRTNWKLTTLSPNQVEGMMATTTGNSFTLIVTTRKPQKRKT